VLRELNNEAILLLYLADEMPAEDRAEVERMLQSDAEMRSALARLESAVGAFETAMSTSDARPLASESAAIRRISMAMRRHSLESAAVAAASSKTAPALTLRYPWWTYPAIGAAAVLVISASWWGSRTDAPMKLPAEPQAINRRTSDPNKVLAFNDEQEIIANFDNPNPTIAKDTVASLDALQNQVAELSRIQPIPFSGDDSELTDQ
jgi:anti-sigma factor RsiW